MRVPGLGVNGSRYGVLGVDCLVYMFSKSLSGVHRVFAAYVGLSGRLYASTE